MSLVLSLEFYLVVVWHVDAREENCSGDVEYNNNTILSKPYMKQSYDSPKLKGSVNKMFMCALN